MAHAYWSTDALIFNAGLGKKFGDPLYKELMRGFSAKELRVLVKHPDLVVAIREIAEADVVDVADRLETDHDLAVDDYTGGRICIGLDRPEEEYPSWIRPEQAGWFKDIAGGEFLEWGRKFLLQGVRVQIWVRYLEHKDKEKNKKADRRIIDVTGLY